MNGQPFSFDTSGRWMPAKWAHCHCFIDTAVCPLPTLVLWLSWWFWTGRQLGFTIWGSLNHRKNNPLPQTRNPLPLLYALLLYTLLNAVLNDLLNAVLNAVLMLCWMLYWMLYAGMLYYMLFFILYWMLYMVFLSLRENSQVLIKDSDATWSHATPKRHLFTQVNFMSCYRGIWFKTSIPASPPPDGTGGYGSKNPLKQEQRIDV